MNNGQRIPPGLLYLTIYNPTLRPSTVPSGDEDAQEQAHILFYTAREQAVSRDRMLRQVGLAKALISFSDTFNPAEPCQNVHSQSRRMIMVSPEPDYWIHACLEVARTSRPTSFKSKGKDKKKAKGKAKEKDDAPSPAVIYDYHDGSLHDFALRTHIMRGYELFKLTHGSFASILDRLGQQALELQLERFFSPWAWRWDLEEEFEFGPHLGVPLHPLHRTLRPLLDQFVSTLPDELTVFCLLSPFVIPSTRYSSASYPQVLASHIMSRTPPVPRISISDHSDTIRASTVNTPSPPVLADASSTTKKVADTLNFLAIPNMSLNRWNWSYLTFSKSVAVKSTPLPTPITPTPTTLKEDTAKGEQDLEGESRNIMEGRPHRAVEVDAESLREAITTEAIHTSLGLGSPLSSHNDLPEPSDLEPIEEAGANQVISSAEIETTQSDAPLNAIVSAFSTSTSSSIDLSPKSIQQAIIEESLITLPTFLSTTVYLAEGNDTANMHRKRVLHLTIDKLTFALITEFDDALEPASLAEGVVRLLERVRAAITKEEKKSGADSPIPSATKILQPQDRHIISTRNFTISSSSGFSSRSDQLFSNQELLHSDPDVIEIFSRGQNPQHWHIARRILGVDHDAEVLEGVVYMEIARKESTLADADNELTGAVRQLISQPIRFHG